MTCTAISNDGTATHWLCSADISFHPDLAQPDTDGNDDAGDVENDL
jgi:hypothetical protein